MKDWLTGHKIKNFQQGGTIRKDTRNWLERKTDNIYGLWNQKKPQLFKDFPILDPYTPAIEYITGNTQMEGVIGGSAPIGGFLKFNKYKKEALKDLVSLKAGKKGREVLIPKDPSVRKSEDLLKHGHSPYSEMYHYSPNKQYPDELLWKGLRKDNDLFFLAGSRRPKFFQYDHKTAKPVKLSESKELLETIWKNLD